MGKMTITGQRTEVRFEYQDDRVIVTGSFMNSSSDDAVKNVSANICKNNEGQPGDFVGSISGYRDNRGMCYGMNDVPEDYLDDVHAAIKAIGQVMTNDGEEVGDE